MPKVTAEHRDARRREIAQAALRLFARKGFQGTSVADIIAESGLSAGAIYGNYKNKDELVQAAATELLEFRLSNAAAIDDGAPPRPPGEMVERIVHGITSEVADLGVLVQVWGQATLDPAMREATTRVAEKLRDTFEEYLVDWYTRGLGLPAGEAATAAASTASLYVGIMQGYVVQSTISTTFDAEAYLAAVSSLAPVAPPRA
ncbi:TetR/AcrR family transcriptional regulator [Frondihabitans australicus]|uniref:TetR family transcriptional regulator n=1 Tax=Frondihabitans australicus TaxID=386892 RepID=A0A495IKH3_9MICO|nr:TetR/AcrR family transcriptional regulator [Frondihabitans australicus]RKR76289.1 TetR family transcriptional regulator [Frondihabitans australicus]